MGDENFLQGAVADIVKLNPGEGDLIVIVFRGPMTPEVREAFYKSGEHLKREFPNTQFLVVDDRVNINLLTAEELRMVGYLHNDHLCPTCRALLEGSYRDEIPPEEETGDGEEVGA